LQGYRGQPGVDLDSLINCIQSIANFVETHKDTLIELDINPLAANATKTIALDALIIEKES